MKLLLSILLFSTISLAKPLKVMVIDTGLDFRNPYVTRNVSKKLMRNRRYIVKHTDSTSSGHGTHVTGIIVENICENVEIIPCKFWTSSTNLSNIDREIKCINIAAKLRVDIINFSAGGKKSIYVEKNAIYRYLRRKNSIFVAAAGNNGQNLKNHPYYPAYYKLKGLIVVGSLSSEGYRSNTSNYMKGMTWEKGENVLSWVPGIKKDYKSGTSMAAAVHTNRLIRRWCKKHK